MRKAALFAEQNVPTNSREEGFLMTEKDMQKAETTGAITRAQPEDTVKRLALAQSLSYLLEEIRDIALGR